MVVAAQVYDIVAHLLKQKDLAQLSTDLDRKKNLQNYKRNKKMLIIKYLLRKSKVTDF